MMSWGGNVEIFVDEYLESTKCEFVWRIPVCVCR